MQSDVSRSVARNAYVDVAPGENDVYDVVSTLLYDSR